MYEATLTKSGEEWTFRQGLSASYSIIYLSAKLSFLFFLQKVMSDLPILQIEREGRE
jgi:hypothetical protein